MTKKLRIVFTLLLTMLFLSLSGCAGATPVPEMPTEEPTEENVPDPDPVSVSEPVSLSEPVEVDYCLDCHTDKQRLIDTAKPEEVVISENEGEG